jgi:hypothetical protein
MERVGKWERGKVAKRSDQIYRFSVIGILRKTSSLFLPTAFIHHSSFRIHHSTADSMPAGLVRQRGGWRGVAGVT